MKKYPVSRVVVAAATAVAAAVVTFVGFVAVAVAGERGDSQ
jgi:hypothetical protein